MMSEEARDSGMEPIQRWTSKRKSAYGHRRLWAILRFVEGIKINKKKVYRILREKGWFVNQRISLPRPRVRAISSSHGTSNSKWAVDMTHIPCGWGGWGHLIAVLTVAIGKSLVLSLRFAAERMKRNEPSTPHVSNGLVL